MTPRAHEHQVGDDRIRQATGRGRREWFALLDAAGAEGWDHARIARWLGGEHDVDGWWAQSVTVGYEQARGLRRPGQRPDGSFDVNATKTLHAPATRVWPYLAEDELRSDWLDVDWRLIGMTEPRSVRLHADDGSRVTLLLTELPPGKDGRPKVRVQVQHSRLADPAAVEETKRFWRSCLAGLADQMHED